MRVDAGPTLIDAPSVDEVNFLPMPTLTLELARWAARRLSGEQLQEG